MPRRKRVERFEIEFVVEVGSDASRDVSPFKTERFAKNAADKWVAGWMAKCRKLDTASYERVAAMAQTVADMSFPVEFNERREVRASVDLYGHDIVVVFYRRSGL